MTQDNNDTSNKSQADELGTGSAADQTAVAGALTLAELNAALGKDFKDKPTALKALKDSLSYVGKRKEDIAAEMRASILPDTASKQDVQSLKDELFYTQNPEYKEYASIISKMGATPSEVVGSSEFKNLYEKVKVADEVAKTKSVVSSNRRLDQSKTVRDEAVVMANARGSTMEDVATVLARGITEEYTQN